MLTEAQTTQQAINLLIARLHTQGLKEVVICPGSRSAPLSLAATRHTGLKTYVLRDERAAGYFALGLALASEIPVGIVTTSGTAVLNLAPAVAEAFFQKVPLIILSADRPKEWVGQQDNQAVYQEGIFGKNCLHSVSFGPSYGTQDDFFFLDREAINSFEVAHSLKGPVHLNIQIREPFYTIPEDFGKFPELRKVSFYRPKNVLPREAINELGEALINKHKILVLAGQINPDKDLENAVYAFCEYAGAVCLAEPLSNLGYAKGALSNFDLAEITIQNKEDILPDLLITVGNAIVSKKVKGLIKKNKSVEHWHLQPEGNLVNPFQTLEKVIYTDPTDFFTRMGEVAYFKEKSSDSNSYQQLFKQASEATGTELTKILNENAQSEFASIKWTLEAVPELWNVHIANSMAVRYVGMLGCPKQRLNFFGNRGTSGIDGSSSTAIGFANGNLQNSLLISGDTAFLYDSNFLWHEYRPKNFKIIVLNNLGGNIFSIIDGPRTQPELKEIFEARHNRSAENWCLANEVSYQSFAENEPIKLDGWFENDGIALIEKWCNPEENHLIFERIKQILKDLAVGKP